MIKNKDNNKNVNINGLYTDSEFKEQLSLYNKYTEVIKDNEDSNEYNMTNECTDDKNNKINKYNKNESRMCKKRERKEKYTQHLKFLSENTGSYPQPAYYIKEKYAGGTGFIPVPEPYYKRLYKGGRPGNRYTFYKRYANKRVRQSNNELRHKSNDYRRIFDYKWECD